MTQQASTGAPDRVPPQDCLPSIDDVAALLRARTKDTNGNELGTFTDQTRPNAEQAQLQIDAAQALVLTRLPADIPARYGDAVAALVAYRAALRIEKSYFPEQIASARSAYEQLYQEYTDDLQALLDALADAGDGGYGTAGHRAHSEWTPTFLRVAGGFGCWPEPENPANWRYPLQPPRCPPLPGDLPVGDQPASGHILR